MSLGTVVAMPLGFVALYYIDPVAAKRLVAVVVAASTIAMFFGFRLKNALPRPASQGSPPVLSLANRYRYAGDGLFALPSDAKTSRANAVAWLLWTPPMLLMHGFVGTLTPMMWRPVPGAWSHGWCVGRVAFSCFQRTVVPHSGDERVTRLELCRSRHLRRVYLPHQGENSRSTRCVKPQIILLSNSTAGMSAPAQSMVVAWLNLQDEQAPRMRRRVPWGRGHWDGFAHVEHARTQVARTSHVQRVLTQSAGRQCAAKAQLYTHLFESFAHGGELELAVIVLCPATGESDITGPTVSCAFHPFDKTDRRSRRATGEHNRHTCAFLVSEPALRDCYAAVGAPARCV